MRDSVACLAGYGAVFACICTLPGRSEFSPNRIAMKTIQMTQALYDYLLANSLREHPAQAKLREETSQLKYANMQISPDQGQFMGLLVKLMGARRIIEVGTFTGYSALSMALALPEDGVIIACDVSEEWTAVGQKQWAAAGVDGRIDLRIAPALETLDGLLAEGGAGSFDLAFVDADKVNYDNYYERLLQLVRPGGALLFDNVLWGGDVIDPENQTPETVALRELNAKIMADERVEISMLPIADGLTIARRR